MGTSKAEAFVDKPLVNNELHDIGPVCEGVWEAGFAFFVFKLGVSSLSSLLTATSAFTSSFLFPTHQELDHSADLSQVLGPIHDSLLLCRGLEV